MTRRFRAMVLAASVIVAWAAGASSAQAQALGSIFGKVTDASGGVLPGVTVTVTGTGLQQPLVATTSENGTYQFPSVPIGTYHRHLRACELQEGGAPERRHHHRLQRRHRSEARNRPDDGGSHGLGGRARRRHQEDDDRRRRSRADILEKIPTARDPWQIVNMTPGVQLTGYNVGGSPSGQQLTPSVARHRGNVQWNLEGGSITDLSSNSSPSYFNFDSFDRDPGDHRRRRRLGAVVGPVDQPGDQERQQRVQGLRSTATFENDTMQGQNVTKALFDAGANGFLSGNPLKKIADYSVEAGGPILKDKLWFWGAVDQQDINVGIINFFDASARHVLPAT